jgi:hypothetical protein
MRIADRNYFFRASLEGRIGVSSYFFAVRDVLFETGPEGPELDG